MKETVRSMLDKARCEAYSDFKDYSMEFIWDNPGIMIAMGHRVTKHYRELLRDAVDNKNYDLVRGLIELGNININGSYDTRSEFVVGLAPMRLSTMTALQHAVLNKDIKMTKLLVELKADINIELAHISTPSPLAIASGLNNFAIVELLLQNKADINAGIYQSPLTSAAINGYDDMVKYLVEHDANVNILNKINDTPLSKAVSYGQPSTVRLLLSLKADVDIIGRDGDMSLCHLRAKPFGVYKEICSTIFTSMLAGTQERIIKNEIKLANSEQQKWLHKLLDKLGHQESQVSL